MFYAPPDHAPFYPDLLNLMEDAGHQVNPPVLFFALRPDVQCKYRVSLSVSPCWCLLLALLSNQSVGWSA